MSRKKQPVILSRNMQRFTGREYFQEIFEDTLSAMKNESEAESYRALVFYGIGGIGKTTLKDRLIHVLCGDIAPLKSEISETIYAEYDFAAAPKAETEMHVLIYLRNSLGAQGLKFKYFDAALNKINDLKGDVVAKSIVLDQNQVLDGAVSMMGAMPVVGAVSNALQGMDKLGAIFKERFFDTKDPIIGDEIQHMALGELKKELRKYFAMDMQKNMAKLRKDGKNVVIFLDTYEKYVDTFVNDIEGKTDDYWLRRGKNSLMQSIPGILWVITGREKLDWDERDAGWNQDNLKNYALNDLSREETIFYLKKCGIDDEKLCNGLYELTSGTPLFLSICVEEYDAMGGDVTIDDFGVDIDELVGRYLNDMQPHFREISYYVSLLGRWDDDTAIGLGEILKQKGVLSNFTREHYTEFMNHSLVVKQACGFSYMHNTVQLACLDRVPQNMCCIFYEVVNEVYENILEEIADPNALIEYIDSAFENKPPYDMALEMWETFIRDKLIEYFGNGDNITGMQISDILHHHVSEVYPGSGYLMAVKCFYAEFLALQGENDKALKMADDEMLDEFYGDISAIDYVQSVLLRAQVYQICEEYEKALAQYERAYGEASSRAEDDGNMASRAENAKNGIFIIKSLMGTDDALDEAVNEYNRKKNDLGEEHRDTLRARMNVGFALLGGDEYEDALSEFLEVYALALGELGEEDKLTLEAYEQMALCYSFMGEDDKTCDIYEDIYNIIRNRDEEIDDDTVKVVYDLINAYINAGRYSKLDLLFEELLAKIEEVFGKESNEVKEIKKEIENIRKELGI